mgnify:CR=1 FL=1
MKKFFAILIGLLFVFALNAQDKTISNGGTAGVTNSTAAVKVAAYNYVYKIDFPAPYLYTYSVKLIDNTGSNTATAVLAGSLDNSYYKTITSVSYTGVGADTTIIGGITSAPLSYKYLRWTITPSDTMWVKSIWMNVVPSK